MRAVKRRAKTSYSEDEETIPIMEIKNSTAQRARLVILISKSTKDNKTFEKDDYNKNSKTPLTCQAFRSTKKEQMREDWEFIPINNNAWIPSLLLATFKASMNNNIEEGDEHGAAKK